MSKLFLERIFQVTPNPTSHVFVFLAHHHDDVADGHVGLLLDDREPHCLSATREFSKGDDLCHTVFDQFWSWLIST
jgi:hypothetical protein